MSSDKGHIKRCVTKLIAIAIKLLSEIGGKCVLLVYNQLQNERITTEMTLYERMNFNNTMRDPMIRLTRSEEKEMYI